MEKCDFNKISLMNFIKKSFKSKKNRDFLIENCMALSNNLIDIQVVKLINNHPIKTFKETMLNLLGHKKLEINVLIYISSLGYYPEAFYQVLIEKSEQCLSHQEYVSFLDYNIKYIMEIDEFLESINYINSISIEKKKEIVDYLKENRLIK